MKQKPETDIMKIQHEEKEGNGRHFILGDNGKTVAEITYTSRTKETLVVDHTRVDEDLQGQQIGLQLVKAVVERARAEGKKIVPQCPFVRSVINKTPDFMDVLA